MRNGNIVMKLVSGQKVILNLNGHTIDAGESDMRVFTVGGGELTIEGSGTITGGHAASSVGGGAGWRQADPERRHRLQP